MRALEKRRELGFFGWTTRLARSAASDWRVAQISNAYV